MLVLGLRVPVGRFADIRNFSWFATYSIESQVMSFQMRTSTVAEQVVQLSIV